MATRTAAGGETRPMEPWETPSSAGTFDYHQESFTSEESEILARYFTNVDSPVFAVINLPEVVKGALFARYSRSPKSVRRLFLDEFIEEDAVLGAGVDDVGVERATDLFQRVFTEYGDDSVAQLGGVHLACEQASNVLTKVLEWGRLAAYLEQSTRYMLYDKKTEGHYPYRVPPEVVATGHGPAFRETADWLFDAYSELVSRLVPYYETLFPKQESDSNFIWRSTIRAKACDDVRGLLPAATTSNVGIYATGQAYEMMLLRMRAHPLAEVRWYADRMLEELRLVIPAFLRRVDEPDRGGRWSRYLEDVSLRMESLGEQILVEPEARSEVELVEWDPDGELKVVAAALYAYTDLPDDQLLGLVEQMSAEERAAILAAYVGDRTNRRHKPGRAMERTRYRFDVLCDYGIFRDLQRHRMLTIEWQPLSPTHGYVVPDSIDDIGAVSLWREGMERAADLWQTVMPDVGRHAAQYAVPFGYRIRFYMDLNARAAFHLIELRTARGGHPDYRRVCQEMHRLIAEEAGHRAIAEAMSFVDYADYDLARLESERRAAARRAAAGVAEPD